MQEGFRASALGHGFFQPKAQLFGQSLDLGRGIFFLRQRLQVFQWILPSSRISTGWVEKMMANGLRIGHFGEPKYSEDGDAGAL